MDNDFYRDESENKVMSRREERNKNRIHNDFKEILSTISGRRFIWELLSETAVFQTSFTGDNQTFFKEGKRDIGLFILNRIFSVAPDSLTTMRTEYELYLKNEALSDEENRKNL